jgi:hypothetical protein
LKTSLSSRQRPVTWFHELDLNKLGDPDIGYGEDLVYERLFILFAQINYHVIVVRPLLNILEACDENQSPCVVDLSRFLTMRTSLRVHSAEQLVTTTGF